MNKILVSTILLSISLPCPGGAAETEGPWKQVLILRPVREQGPPMEFDYNFRNAVPPFEKEPPLAGKVIARGLIPTVPPTPLIRNITDRELYLKADHGRDFTTGPSVTYQSQCQDGIHVVFNDLRVFTRLLLPADRIVRAASRRQNHGPGDDSPSVSQPSPTHVLLPLS